MKTPIKKSPPQFTRAMLTAWQAICAFGAAVLITEAVETGTVEQSAKASIAQTQTPASPDALSATASKSESSRDRSFFENAMGLIIALAAVVMGIGVAFVAIWADYRKRKDLLNICHQERMAALDKGLDLPPIPNDFFGGTDGESERPASPLRGLKSGLTWLGLGIGLAIFLSFQEGRDVSPFVGAIPIGIGVARIIGFLIERRWNPDGKAES